MKSNSQRIIFKSTFVAAALTGLFAGSASAESPNTEKSNAVSVSTPVAGTPAAENSHAGKHDCKAMNDCKGQAGCKADSNGCEGKNSCNAKDGCSSSEEEE